MRRFITLVLVTKDQTISVVPRELTRVSQVYFTDPVIPDAGTHLNLAWGYKILAVDSSKLEAKTGVKTGPKQVGTANIAMSSAVPKPAGDDRLCIDVYFL